LWTQRLELAITQLTTLLANVNRDPKRKPEPFALEDFMLRTMDNDEDEKRQARVARGIERLNILLGGKLIDLSAPVWQTGRCDAQAGKSR